MDKKQSKQKIEFLVQTFHTEKHEKMNEAETRLRFIDPFFEALGWNIRNPREVRIETPASRSDSTRPDYRFLIDGKTKFFVEAKKPSVKLTDLTPVFQAKSYGFSSKVPIVILTDFEEFRPFRTLARPKYEKPLDGLIREFDLTYDRYVDQFNSLYETFSHEAVVAGELEKRIPTEKKEASTTVDKEFLKDLSNWQEELAKNIALRNSKLSVSEINEAVQRILDRIIFLRICEDRQIEESEILLSYANSGDDIYRRLLKEFTRLRAKYNGLIFNEHPLSERLSIDDQLLKEIIVNLYLPRSPYRFNVIPIEILGTIYEQYLGKVITLTPTHRVKVEVKPEVRKAGGVFYTPQFITSCIVKNTIGKLIEGKTPEQIAKLKFIDITCGSGSFCLEMFDYMIHYHIDYYSASPDKIKTVGSVPDAFQTSEAHLPDGQGLWHLSTRKKKEILLNNIYGVDIDPQAVEVTQMSLFLKLLEGESAETFGKQLSFELKETILPNLSDNIKCGNSLVGMDIKGLGNNLTLEEELRIRPFDWETAFPEIMAQGGFDAIVGNPPYRVIGKENTAKYLEVYLKTHYNSFQYKADLYHLLIEKAMQLLKKDGLIGYITPHTWFTLRFTKNLRSFVLNNSCINKIFLFNHKVFEDATVDTAITIFKKEQREGERKANEVEVYLLPKEFVPNLLYTTEPFLCRQAEWHLDELNRFEVRASDNMSSIIENIKVRTRTLGEIANASLGCQAYNSSKHTKAQIENRVFHAKKKLSKEYLPELAGSDVGRYILNRQRGEWIKYGPWLHDYRTMEWLSGPRILVREITGKGDYKICAMYVEDTYCNYKTILNVIYGTNVSYSMKYLLGLLNSKLLSRLYPLISNKMVKDNFPRLSVGDLRMLPIRTIDFNNPEDKVMHDKMVQLVERMLDLHKKKQHANADSEKELFEHQIKATDNEIDELVYRLYGLTEEEIKIVERK
jgi:type I restriction-modification system DNA methylase subunit